MEKISYVNLKKAGLFIGILLAASAVVFMVLFYPGYRHDMNNAREQLLTGSQVIETASGPIEYADVGEGYPVLVIHGAGGGYDQGLILAQAYIGDDFRLIAVSRFGYLRTPLPDNASPAAAADAYADLLDELNISRAAVVGVSRGGPSSLQFALRHPNRCSSLVMRSAISHTPQKESFTQKIIFNTIFRSDFVFWLITTKFESSLISTFGVPPEVQANLTPAEKEWVSEFLKSMHPMSLRKAGIYNDRKYNVYDYPIERITAPTLVIHAEDDTLVSFTHGQYTAQNIPGARLIKFKSGGHFLVGQQEKVRLEVAEFLKSSTMELSRGNTTSI